METLKTAVPCLKLGKEDINQQWVNPKKLFLLIAVLTGVDNSALRLVATHLTNIPFIFLLSPV